MSQHYQAYLLRVQRTDPGSPWRVHVENVETGEILRFATEWQLLRFLLQALGTTPSTLPAVPPAVPPTTIHAITDPTTTDSNGTSSHIAKVEQWDSGCGLLTDSGPF